VAVLSACGAHCRIDPDTVVRNCHGDIVAAVIELDGDFVRLCMAQRVGEGLAGNARDIVRDRRTDRPGNTALFERPPKLAIECRPSDVREKRCQFDRLDCLAQPADAITSFLQNVVRPVERRFEIGTYRVSGGRRWRSDWKRRTRP
jgi:hypothetical protein